MNILLTNDDGIQAAGIWRLAEALRPLGRITVVAPERNQSGIGTAKSLHAPVPAREYPSPLEGVRAVSVGGTPADCVILAAESLSKELFDLVLSGINEGANLGLDIMSSGTVGAALQGYYRNIPSVAVSVTSINNVQFDGAINAAKALAQALLAEGKAVPAPLLLNVNLPNISPDLLQGIELTRLGPRAYMENVEPEGEGGHYRIMHNKPVGDDAEAGTDIWAIRNNSVSITPLNGLLASVEGTALSEALAREVGRALGIRT
jgi:5'-nucleotidase